MYTWLQLKNRYSVDQTATVLQEGLDIVTASVKTGITWIQWFFMLSTKFLKADRNYDGLLQPSGLENTLKSLQEITSDQLLMQLLPLPTLFDS